MIDCNGLFMMFCNGLFVMVYCVLCDYLGWCVCILVGFIVYGN